MRSATVLAALVAVSAASAADDLKPLFELPVATLRAGLPDKGQDGVPFTVHGGKENADDWFEIALGKRLKVRTEDRKPEKETVLGAGFAPRDGYIDVHLGWRGRKKGSPWAEFDGTLTARLSLTLVSGKWDVRVDAVKAHWDQFLPGVAEAGNAVVQQLFADWVKKDLAAQLDAVTAKELAKLPAEVRLYVPATRLSASLAGDKFVVRGVQLTPLLDLGRVVDRRARDGRGVDVPAGNFDKLKIAIVDRASLDAAKATAFSSIVVDDKIDGQSSVSLKTAPGATTVVRGRLDGQSGLTIDAPGGHVEFHDRIDGQSSLAVHAPGGHVEFHRRVDGQCKLTITAKTVVFRERVDGGKETKVVLTLPGDGRATCPEFNADILVKYPAGQPPEVVFEKRNRDGRLTTVPFVTAK